MSNIYGDETIGNYLHVKTLIPHYDKYLSRMCELVSINCGDINGAKLVDLGCGPCFLLEKLTEEVDNVELIGVDSSIGFKEAFLTRNKAGFSFVSEDIYSWLCAQESESIDFVCSSWVFHNWDSDYRKLVFKELGRVIKLNGLLINADKIQNNDETNNNKALMLQMELFFKHLKDIPQALESWVLHYIKDEKPGVRFTKRENQALHTEVGLSPPLYIESDTMDCLSISKKLHAKP